MKRDHILIEHGTIITLDEERRIIKKGAIAVEGSEISYVGKMSGLRGSAREGGRVINAEGKLVLPGFVNTHMHLEYSGIGRGFGDDVSLPTFVNERMRPSEAATSPEDVYISTMLACLEMIKTGTTCVCDTGGFHPDSVAKGVEEAGIRATVAYGSMDTSPPERPLVGGQQMTTGENLRRSEDLIRKWHGGVEDRIRVRCSSVHFQTSQRNSSSA